MASQQAEWTPTTSALKENIVCAKQNYLEEKQSEVCGYIAERPLQGSADPDKSKDSGVIVGHFLLLVQVRGLAKDISVISKINIRTVLDVDSTKGQCDKGGLHSYIYRPIYIQLFLKP